MEAERPPSRGSSVFSDETEQFDNEMAILLAQVANDLAEPVERPDSRASVSDDEAQEPDSTWDLVPEPQSPGAADLDGPADTTDWPRVGIRLRSEDGPADSTTTD